MIFKWLSVPGVDLYARCHRFIVALKRDKLRLSLIAAGWTYFSRSTARYTQYLTYIPCLAN